NKSLSDMIDLGQSLISQVPNPSKLQAATGAALQSYLQSLPGLTNVSSTAENGDVLFKFTFGKDFNQPLPFQFDVKDTLGAALGAMVNVSGTGTVSIAGHADADVILGLRTTGGLALQDRVFLGTAGNN